MKLRVDEKKPGGTQTIIKYKTGLKGSSYSYNLSTDSRFSSVYKNLTASNILIVVTAGASSTRKDSYDPPDRYGGYYTNAKVTYTASSGALTIKGSYFQGRVDSLSPAYETAYETFDVYIYF